jgi:hypothetical protein
MLPGRYSINVELQALMALHLGHEAIERERDKRKSMQDNATEKRRMCALYAGSERRQVIQRSLELVLDELRIAGPFAELDRVRKLVEVYFWSSNENGQSKPLLDWELDFAMRCR